MPTTALLDSEDSQFFIYTHVCVCVYIYVYIFFPMYWLLWVFIAVHGLFLVAVSGDQSLLWSAGFSYFGGFSHCRAQALGTWAQQLWPPGFSCSVACGIFLDQGSKPMSPALTGRFLTTREVLDSQFFSFFLDSQFSLQLHDGDDDEGPRRPYRAWSLCWGLSGQPLTTVPISRLKINISENYFYRKTCSQMFTAALFIVSKTWKQS